MKFICSFILKRLGWTVVRQYDFDLDKIIVAVVPHTSNWDFFLGILVKYSQDFHPNFIGKKSLFFWPLSIVLKNLGGIPVDRSSRNNFVDQIADLYGKHDKLAIALAPEGTRKKVDKLKTGFYYIAKKAKVPIVLISFDFQHKKIIFRNPFYPSDDAKNDLVFITQSFDNILGKIPENSIGFKPKI